MSVGEIVAVAMAEVAEARKQAREKQTSEDDNHD
jgi:hypothetical protein